MITPLLAILNHNERRYVWVTSNKRNSEISILSRYKSFNERELLLKKDRIDYRDKCGKVEFKKSVVFKDEGIEIWEDDELKNFIEIDLRQMREQKKRLNRIKNEIEYQKIILEVKLLLMEVKGGKGEV